jgi:serine/threonine-protein kinase
VVQFGVAALALAAVAGWLTLRRSGSALSSIWTRTPLTRSRRSRPSAPSPAGPLSPGAVRDDLGRQWFGDFQLLELLGRGGMASVYRADRGGELVALKRPLTAFLENPDFVKRFEREADIGRTLNHPNIVRILERGDVEGVPYFTMELVVGQTLQGLLKTRGALEPQAAAGVVAQAAEALDLAHGKGVIHRDLKPSNIMLLPDGTAKVMDFGIASARRFEGLTATGDFLGTPDYVAPEVIEGSDAEPRSDLYSLGIVFYELLTGRRPFTGDTPFAILKKHCTETPPPPSRLRGDVPQDLDAVVVRLLEKEPAARFKDAEELVVTLRDWLNRSA